MHQKPIVPPYLRHRIPIQPHLPYAQSTPNKSQCIGIKRQLFHCLPFILFSLLISAQESRESENPKDIANRLVASYAQARERKDTMLLNQILTTDIDQLVSSGEWRKGLPIAKSGMLRSSENNPGDRILHVEQVRELTPDCLIADARYRIRNQDGTERKMWSTFLIARRDSLWKIAAIRNMLPAGTN